ncbi:MAG: TonB-dependent receptor [Thermoanaerobaculia bacterium]
MRNLSSQTKKLFAFITLLAFALAPLNALQAQQATDDAEQAVEESEEVADEEPADELMDEIIVTGTASGSEILKFDASFAITTLPDDEIAKFAPKSSADLLKLVPGVWSESSGGVSGANVFVRGFPGGGDAPFLTVQVNGSSFFPPPTLSFLENTTLFRLDETVLRMEALRGGPNPVFSNGQPGLTTNFILREGGEETEGFVKYSTSDYDLRRFDGYVSGKVSDDFYYMLGGYVSSSPGLRDSGFNSDEGFQFTANLTRNLERGKINIFHRETDDSGTWYLPVALNVPGVDNQYNQIGALNRQRRILFANNFGDPSFDNPGAKTVDLGEGRGWDGGLTGGSIAFDIADDWELVNRFSYMSGDANTLGLVPNGGALQIGALRADPTLDPAAVITGPITGSVSGRAIADSEFIQQFGAWEVLKDIEAFTNDLSLTKNFDRGNVTFGLYSANSSTDEFWSLGNHKYEVVQVGGEVVTGIECNDDQTVDSCAWNYDIDARGDATTSALYAATTFEATDRWTLDFGVRSENHKVEYSVDEGLDGLVTLGLSFDETETSWTAAANYLINDSLGAFGRINSGSKMPYFDDFRDNRGAFQGGNLLIQEVDQLEFGLKWVTSNLSLYGTAFRTEVDPTFFIALTGAGPADIVTQEATGIELDALWNSGTGFYVTLNATIQDTEIKRGPNAGNETQRQPGWQLRLTPSYTFVKGDSVITLFGTLSAVDDRWGEPQNVNRLDGYEKLDLGAIVDLSGGFSVHISGDNLTDEDALTESDPRDLVAPNGRFIMPQSIRVGVGYSF